MLPKNSPAAKHHAERDDYTAIDLDNSHLKNYTHRPLPYRIVVRGVHDDDTLPVLDLGGMAFLLCTAGCVERRFVITTDPPNAIVEVNDKVRTLPRRICNSPTMRNINLLPRRKASKSWIRTSRSSAPWYEWVGLDFISEIVIPWTIRDVSPYSPDADANPVYADGPNSCGLGPGTSRPRTSLSERLPAPSKLSPPPPRKPSCRASIDTL